jgi:hypothetical protein
VRPGRPAHTCVKEGGINVNVAVQLTVGLGAELAVGRGVKLGVTVPEGVGEIMTIVGEIDDSSRAGMIVIGGGSGLLSGM